MGRKVLQSNRTVGRSSFIMINAEIQPCMGCNSLTGVLRSTQLYSAYALWHSTISIVPSWMNYSNK